MTKFSVFTKTDIDPKWKHWGWFDKRKDAIECAAWHKICYKATKTRICHTNVNDDFAAIADKMI